MNDEHERQENVVGGAEHDHRHGAFRVAVAEGGFDFHDLRIDDPRPTGRQVLEEAGFRPAEEHLVFKLLENGALEELRLGETTNIRGGGVERFIVFRSDRSFRVEIDERRFEWGATELSGLHGRLLAGVDPKCAGLWLERRDAIDLFIRNDDVVKLSGEGVERLYTGPVYILCIEGEEVAWREPTITTEQIAELGGWEVSQGVQEINLATNEARTLKPGEVVELKNLKSFAKKIGWRRG